MPDQGNVFSDQQSAPATPEHNTQQSAPQNPYQDLLLGIKNEQGQPKYASVEEALKALQHSQEYIPQIRSQLSEKERLLAEYQAKLEQQESLEQVVSRLTAQQKEQQAQGEPPRASGLDEAAVAKLVQQQLEQERQMTAAQANQAQVQNALQARYGDKAAEMVKAKAAELGTTPAELGALSSKNPAMVLALFNAQAPTGPKPTTSSVNIPPSYKPDLPELKRPEKSLLLGASSKDQMEFMRQVRERVYAKHGINSN